MRQFYYNPIMKSDKKSCAFFTFGCKVNQYETEVIRERFKSYGFSENRQNPHLCIINGCTLTSAADRKCRNLIKTLHKKNPKACIIVTGCFAQNQPQINQDLAGISYVIPQGLKEMIPEIILGKLDLNSKASGINSLPVKERHLDTHINNFSQHDRAFVKIQDGCNNFCSYCIVPYLRGQPQSKSMPLAVQEVSKLVRKGFKEIVLSGINLGMWGQDFGNKQNLVHLIQKLSKLQGLMRLRLSSIELNYINNALIGQFLKSEKLCRHLHIPLQSGDDFILKKMNRNYTSYKFLKKVEMIRKRVKDIALTTDVIVGFPGEEGSHFKNTLKLVREAGFLRIHIFSFSRRDKTKAAQFPYCIDRKTIEQRKNLLKEEVIKSSFSLRKQLLQKTVRVLFEAQENGCWQGYSDNYVRVSVATRDDLKNRLLPVKIIDVTTENTIGKIL